jgi:hypothetical protein
MRWVGLDNSRNSLSLCVSRSPKEIWLDWKYLQWGYLFFPQLSPFIFPGHSHPLKHSKNRLRSTSGIDRVSYPSISAGTSCSNNDGAYLPKCPWQNFHWVTGEINQTQHWKSSAWNYQRYSTRTRYTRQCNWVSYHILHIHTMSKTSLPGIVIIYYDILGR